MSTWPKCGICGREYRDASKHHSEFHKTAPLSDSKGAAIREKILETIKGFEPVGHLDGTPEQKTIAAGYDLEKDERTEFGFYWEYEDMEDCADKLLAILAQDVKRLIGDDEPVELDYADYPRTGSLEAHGRNSLRAEMRRKAGLV